MTKPSFMVIGVQKSGTTTLFVWLKDHPLIRAHLTKKEIHYFDQNFGRGKTWYESQFPKLGKNEVAFEASPCYIFYPEVPKLIQGMYNKIKFITIMRNPMDRAFSLYQYNRRKGYEPYSFKKALELEEERLVKNRRSYDIFGYKKRGMYGEQVERWLKYFPKEQCLFMQSEELWRNVTKNYTKIIEFLGLPVIIPNSVKRKKAYNKGFIKGNLKDRDLLKGYFDESNEKLYSLIGERYDWD